MPLPQGWTSLDQPQTGPKLPQGWSMLDPQQEGVNQANAQANAVANAGGVPTGEAYGQAFNSGYERALSQQEKLKELQAQQTITKRLEPADTEKLAAQFSALDTISQVGDMYNSAYKAASAWNGGMFGSWFYNIPGNRGLASTHPEVEAYTTQVPAMAMKISRGVDDAKGVGNEELQKAEMASLPTPADSPQTAATKLYQKSLDGYIKVYNNVSALAGQNHDVSNFMPQLQAAYAKVQAFKQQAEGVQAPSGAIAPTGPSDQANAILNQRLGAKPSPTPGPQASPTPATGQ